MAIQDPRIKPQRLTTEVARFFPPQGQWTETEYFALPDSNIIVELSEGELIMPPLPNFSHQSTSMKLTSELNRLNKAQNLGILLYSPFAIRLWHGKVREPDIVFFLKAHADRIGEQVSGPPDLAIEILSPATRKQTAVTSLTNMRARESANTGWLIPIDTRWKSIF